MAKIFDLATLIVFGAMLADLVLHPAGTKNLIDGLTSIWSASINAVNPPGSGG